MGSTIQRNTIVSPFPLRTPFTADSKVSKKGETLGVVSWPHTKFFQEVEAGVNASPQLTATVPANSGAPGQPGTMAFDANYLYVCVGLNIWRRVALASF